MSPSRLPTGPDPEAITRVVLERYPETVVAEALGATFFSLDEKHWPNFATIVTTDEHDAGAPSDLARPGAFRLNIGVGRETFERVVGWMEAPDYTAYDRLLPHPVYAKQHWISILNPSDATFRETALPLIGEAHDRLIRDRRSREECQQMGKVSAGATMSLDGFIAGPNDTGFDLLFKWYYAGDVEVPMPDSTAEVPPPHVSPATAELLRQEQASWGSLVVGRHLYDLTNAWNGRHPLDATTVVLTHQPPADRPIADDNFVFVTEGIEAAVAKAKEIAGDRNVAVNGGQMARQALEAGLLDEIGVDLVPVILGAGTRLFADLGPPPVEFEGPILVVEGIGVTHLRYRVVK